jgi:hypothetical protein
LNALGCLGSENKLFVETAPMEPVPGEEERLTFMAGRLVCNSASVLGKKFVTGTYRGVGLLFEYTDDADTAGEDGSDMGAPPSVP